MLQRECTACGNKATAEKGLGQGVQRGVTEDKLEGS